MMNLSMIPLLYAWSRYGMPGPARVSVYTAGEVTLL